MSRSFLWFVDTSVHELFTMTEQVMELSAGLPARKRIDRLVRVAAADIAGRPPRQDDFPEGPWLLKRAEELQVKGFRTQAHYSRTTPD